MIPLLAAALALTLQTASPSAVLAAQSSHAPKTASRHHRKRRPPLRTARGASARQPRVIRLARLAVLARRELMLRDYVMRARTETAGFIDDQHESLGNGI